MEHVSMSMQFLSPSSHKMLEPSLGKGLPVIAYNLMKG